MLARGIVVHHKQHVGVALSATGEFRQRGDVAVPHGTRRYGGKQLRHVVRGIHQAFFKRCTHLRLFFFQARGQTCRQALARTRRQSFQTAFDFTSGLLQLH